jgi:hypothetical protein
MKTQNPNLSEILEFKLPPLVRRLQKELRLNTSEAEELFNDTKKFLYLCRYQKVLVPSKAIDECWHRFILYTEEYTKFCLRFFKRWIHHHPLETKRKSDKKTFKNTCLLAKENFGPILSANWKRQGACCSSCNHRIIKPSLS